MNNRRTGLILAYTNKLISMLSGIFLSSFLIKALGDYEYGLHQTMSAFVNYLVIFEFGTGTVMSRNILVAKNNGDKEQVKRSITTVLFISLFLAVVICLVGLVFWANIQNIYAKTINASDMLYCKNMFLIMLVFLVASYSIQTMSGIFLGFENYVMGNVVNLIQIVSRVLVIAVLISFFKYSIMVAIADMLVSSALMIFVLVYCVKKYKISFNIKNFDKRILKTSLPFCLAMLIQVVINQSNGSVNKFIISVKTNMESVTLYSVAIYIYNAVTAMATKPAYMYLPQVSKNMAAGLKGKELTKTLIHPARLVSFVGGTLFFGFVAVGRQFIDIIYGEDYSLAWVIAIIAIAPMFLIMTAEVVVNVIDILNKRHARSTILAITLALNITFILLLIKPLGLLGAVIGTALGMLIGNFLLLNIYYSKAIGIKIFYLYIEAYKGLLPTLVVASAAGFLIAGFIPNNIIAFLVGGTIFVGLEFLGIMYLPANKNEKAIICSLLHKIKK